MDGRGVVDGTAVDGTVVDGTVVDGAVVDGAVVGGTDADYTVDGPELLLDPEAVEAGCSDTGSAAEERPQDSPP